MHSLSLKQMSSMGLGLIATIMVSACAGQDDSASQPPPPAPPTDPGNEPAAVPWSTVMREEIAPTTCARKKLEFSVNTAGNFRYQNCESELTGDITPEELAQLNQITSTLTRGDLEARRCTDLSTGDGQEVSVDLADGRKFSVYENSGEGICTRGDPQQAAILRERLAGLQEKYIITIPIGDR